MHNGFPSRPLAAGIESHTCKQLSSGTIDKEIVSHGYDFHIVTMKSGRVSIQKQLNDIDIKLFHNI